MIGRYGIDELYKFLFNVYLILFFPNIFLRNSIVTKIEFIILFIAIYRVLSKNIKQRRKENKLFLKVKKNVIKPFLNIKRNLHHRLLFYHGYF